MRLSRTVVIVQLAVLFVMCETAAAKDPPQSTDLKLAGPSRQVNFPILSSNAYFRHKWDGRFLVSSGLHASPSNPIVVVNNRDGDIVLQATLWFDDADAVNVTDAALASDGSVIVSGGAKRKDGTISNFLAKIGQDGRLRNVVQTSPYVAYYIRIAPDGTVWTLGLERDDQLRAKESAVLRQYSFEKGELTTALPSISFHTENKAASKFVWYNSFPGGMTIGNQGKMLGFYSAPTAEWITVNLRDHSLIRQQIASLPEHVEITGVAYTDSGEVFASMYAPGNNASLSGLAKLKTSASKAIWVMVPGSSASSAQEAGDTPFYELLGCSQDVLVYRTKSSPSTYVAWSSAR